MAETVASESFCIIEFKLMFTQFLLLDLQIFSPLIGCSGYINTTVTHNALKHNMGNAFFVDG